MEILQVNVSAERAEILIWSIPWFLVCIGSSVVSLECTFFSFEPWFLIQQEFTVAPTVEPHAFVGVVKLKVCSPPSDNQVGSRSISFSSHAAIVVFQQAFVFGILLACVIVATRRVYGGSFPLTFFYCLFSEQLFRDAVFIRVESVSAIVVFTNIIADNWRFFELRLSIHVSLIILIV